MVYDAASELTEDLVASTSGLKGDILTAPGSPQAMFGKSIVSPQAQISVPSSADISFSEALTISLPLSYSLFGGDFYGNGFASLVDRNPDGSGENVSRSLSPISSTEDFSFFGRLVIDLDWRFQATGDFNNDGKDDLLLRNVNGSGQNLIWYMNGSNITKEELIGRPITDVLWNIAGTGDFNHDGKEDILWRNNLYDQTLVWYMDGAAIQSEALVGRGIADASWRVSGTADFNGDGKTDIVWRHLNPDGLGQNIVWFMNDSQIIGEALIGRDVPDIEWQIVGAGDGNGDGKSDLMLRRSFTGAILLWEMDGTQILRETTINSVIPVITN